MFNGIPCVQLHIVCMCLVCVRVFYLCAALASKQIAFKCPQRSIYRLLLSVGAGLWLIAPWAVTAHGVWRAEEREWKILVPALSRSHIVHIMRTALRRSYRVLHSHTDAADVPHVLRTGSRLLALCPVCLFFISIESYLLLLLSMYTRVRFPLGRTHSLFGG